MKPSVFAIYPWGSVLQKQEYEQIARNIMVILGRTGDAFRELTWEEYKKERLTEKNFTENEKHYFDTVLTYCENEERAMTFSPDWRDAYVEELKKIKTPKDTVDTLDIYIGELNTERIAEYMKLEQLYNIDRGIIRDVFCKGAEWGIEISKRK